MAYWPMRKLVKYLNILSDLFSNFSITCLISSSKIYIFWLTIFCSYFTLIFSILNIRPCFNMLEMIKSCKACPDISYFSSSGSYTRDYRQTASKLTGESVDLNY